MPTGFTWSSYQAALVTQIPSLPADPNFATILPACIGYAELTIERDLDLLITKGEIDLGPTVPSVQTYPVPDTVIILESVSSLGPLVPASRDFINTLYPRGATVQGPPKYFMLEGDAQPVLGPSLPTYLLDENGNQVLTAEGQPIITIPAARARQTGQQIRIGPAPDLAYPLIGYGAGRPDPLSATNPFTYISIQMPDLFWAASMIFLAGYNRNFGAQSDDPRQAISWSAEYQRLLKSAEVEQARSKFQAQGWTAQPVANVATPPRN